MSACIFCQILSQQIPSVRVAENDLAVAFLDIRPVNPGHVLVVPRRHVASFTGLTDLEGAQVFDLVRRVGRALKAALPGCEGVTLSAADGEAAHQEVPHAHFHVIPRSPEDGFGWRRFGELAGREALEETGILISLAMALSQDAEVNPARSPGTNG
ncbi:HIT family protein [Verrucomicrobium sp. BvORR106]|uniref:HIT family protein n=1 Tax=Verrucomicrobium sp. BvORR106 TaxID=1403819 RepID=UPI00068DBAB0|nr:HIT family protein [Verrucomicrobium sp. BvORR106]